MQERAFGSAQAGAEVPAYSNSIELRTRPKAPGGWAGLPASGRGIDRFKKLEYWDLAV